MKYFFAAISIAGIVALSFLIDDGSARGPVPTPAPEEASIFAPGRVEGKTLEIELRPELAGRIVELPVQEGQKVERGELLLRIDDEQYQHQVTLAKAELELARAQMERLENGAQLEERAEAAAQHRERLADVKHAERTLERLTKLWQSQSISDQELDNQRSLLASYVARAEAAKARSELLDSKARPDELRMAQARIAAAEARLELTRKELERASLLAPCQGTILKINVEPGELADPTRDEPVIKLVDTTELMVRAFVEEIDAPKVHVGQAVTITGDGLPGRTYSGRVTSTSPHMIAKTYYSDRPFERRDTRVREVWIQLEEHDGLIVGLPVDVDILLGSTASK